MKALLIWKLFGLTVSIVAAILQYQLSGANEALDFGWEKYVACVVAAPASYPTICLPKGSLCASSAECCSKSCVRFRCQ